jgi:hypothetical protein
MKGIYLTQEGKEEIEAKIAQLEKYKNSDQCNWSFVLGRQATLEEILSEAIILSVEESWDGFILDPKDSKYVQKGYPNGVIIKPKES